MNILMMNQDWFAAEFRAAGHRVVTCGISTHLDFVLEFPLIHIDSVITKCFDTEKPDIILVHDNSAPIIVVGLDETVLPTVFYSVDAHHHVDLHRYLALLFDKTLIAQKDYSPRFEELGYTPEWMPLWASCHVEPSTEKKYGAVFVGTLNPELNPERVAFFKELEKRVPIHCQSGGFTSFFPFAEVVINQTVKLDLNFRVFESMMCGAALLTERTGNGLFELFNEGEHLVTYEHGNVEEAAAKITSLLGNIDHTRSIAARGRAEIIAKHLIKHRAAQMLRALETVTKKFSNKKFFASMINFALLGIRLERMENNLAGSAYVNALRAAEMALDHNEELNEDMASYLVIAIARYEIRVNSGAAEELLLKAIQQYPNNTTLLLARIRSCLNQGKISEAEGLAKNFVALEPRETFEKCETYIGGLIAQALAPS